MKDCTPIETAPNRDPHLFSGLVLGLRICGLGFRVEGFANLLRQHEIVPRMCFAGFGFVFKISNLDLKDQEPDELSRQKTC